MVAVLNLDDFIFCFVTSTENDVPIVMGQTWRIFFIPQSGHS